MEEYDPELVAEFVAEAEEELSAAEDALVRIDAEGPLSELLDAAFRSLHTIKSSSGYFDFDDLTGLVHDQEDLLDRLRQGRCEYAPGMGDLLLRAIDAVRGFLERFKAGTPAFADATAVARLRVELTQTHLPDIEQLERAEETVLELEKALRASEGIAGLTPLIEQALSFARGLLDEASEGTSIPDVDLQVTDCIPESGILTPRRMARNAGATSQREASKKTIRVPEARLDEFLEQVGNMVRLRHVIMAVERLLSRHVEDTSVMAQVHDMTATFVRESERLQTGIMSLRQVPIGNVLRKLPRVARDVARMTGKEVRVDIRGEQAEIDKALIEGLESPLVHMLRNAIDHGIEAPKERSAAGKQIVGSVCVEVEDAVDSLRIVVRDDGRGIAPDVVLRKALAAGLVMSRENMTDAEILDLIFAPGFSTADTVTEVSGRGVGMDVVRKRVEQHGGDVRLQSVLGQGTQFSLSVPKSVNTAISQTLMTFVSGSYFAIPMKRVTEVVAVDRGVGHDMIQTLPTGHVLRLREAMIPLIDVGQSLRLSPTFDRKTFSIVLAEEEGGRVGLVVDEVHDVMDVVSQRIDYMAERAMMFSEACIFGDGKIAFLLDVSTMIERQGLRWNPSRAHRSVEREASVAVATPAVRGRSSFLLYDAGHGCSQAIEMEVVHRLEFFALESLQCFAGQVCVRYNRKILPLLVPPGREVGLQEKTPVIVVQSNGQLAGLVVASILDIEVSDRHAMRRAQAPGVDRILVIHGRAVEVIAVDRLEPLPARVLEFPRAHAS